MHFKSAGGKASVADNADVTDAGAVGRFGSAELRGVGGAADVRGSEGGRASPCGWLASPSVMSASV